MGHSPSSVGGLQVDIPTTLHSLVDKEAIDAMSKAVEFAPPVWAMMDSILADLPEKREDILETLFKAQNMTERLKTDISLLQDGMSVERKSLRNDAHLFVKVSSFAVVVYACITQNPPPASVGSSPLNQREVIRRFSPIVCGLTSKHGQAY
jgi:hypothetical protein